MLKKFFVFLIILTFSLIDKTFSWGPITHYHINKETGNYSNIFNTSGMYPDAFMWINPWVDVAHSPDPKFDEETKTYPYANSPNFAYIINYLSENTEQEHFSLGWGGHIASDWVAHKYYKIVDVSWEEILNWRKNIDKILEYLKHGSIELSTDIYNFYKRGAIFPSFRIYPKQVWRSFVNWKLIDEHEKRIFDRDCSLQNLQACITTPQEDLNDRNSALDLVNDLTKGISVDTIKTRLITLNTMVLSEQTAIVILSIKFPEAIHALLLGMELYGVEDKLSESKNVVFQYWLTDKKPRGIPTGYNPANPHPKAEMANPSNPDKETINPDQVFYKFWEDVANKALQMQAIEVIQTEGIDENGEKYIDVETKLKSEQLFEQALAEIINNYINSPNYIYQRFGKWLKRVFIEGNLNVDLILDFDPPEIEILSPSDQEYVNANPLIISGKAVDKNFLSYKLEYGIGENPTNFNLICEGTNPVEDGTLCSWNTTNLSGLYTLKLSAIDKNGNENEVRIKVYISNPVFISSFGKKGKANGEFNQPSFIAADLSNNIYITDTMNHRVQKFDKGGNFLLSFGEKSKGAPSERLGEFNQPMGIAIDNQDNIYIADSLNHRIQEFTKDGVFISSFGKKGNDNGEFNQPIGIAIDSSGNIYVSDSMNHRVQKFDKNGNYIMQFGIKGDNAGQFNQPTGIAIDSKNNIYVADSMNNRIQMFDKDGNFVKIIIDNLKQPEGIIIDKKDNIYISDTMNCRILKLDKYGNKLFEFGTTGFANSQFRQPIGIYVDNKIMYIVDTYNHRVQKFSLKWGPLEKNMGNVIQQKPTEQSFIDGKLKILQAYTYPNPYREKAGEKGKETQQGITFRYKAEGNITRVVIEIYNIKGKLVDKFEDYTIDGEANYDFANRLANGVYIYRITISDGKNAKSKTGKLVVLK